MSDFKKRHPKQAKKCLEHLLYTIPEQTLHDIAATLAQTHAVPVENFANINGHWTWPVVERFLSNRGLKTTSTTLNNHWILDSPKYLSNSPGFIGFIDIDTLESYTVQNNTWTTTQTTLNQEEAYSRLQSGNTVAVHKMWSPLEPFYNQNQAFHITTDETGFLRYECQPTSCWRPEPVSYENRSAVVKNFMRAHKRSPILMSNHQEMVMATPGKSGWKTKCVLSYECFSTIQTSQQIAEKLAAKMVATIEQRGGWDIMAHALWSALHFMGEKMTIDECSNFTPEELDVLKQYENGMYKKDTYSKQ